MGYDANLKSNKAEKRQRSILLLSMAGLAVAAFAVIQLLHKDSSVSSTGAKKLSVQTSWVDE